MRKLDYETRTALAEAYANEYVDARHIDGPIAARIALGVKAGYLKALEDSQSTQDYAKGFADGQEHAAGVADRYPTGCGTDPLPTLIRKGIATTRQVTCTCPNDGDHEGWCPASNYDPAASTLRGCVHNLHPPKSCPTCYPAQQDEQETEYDQLKRQKDRILAEQAHLCARCGMTCNTCAQMADTDAAKENR